MEKIYNLSEDAHAIFSDSNNQKTFKKEIFDGQSDENDKYLNKYDFWEIIKYARTALNKKK